MHLIREGNGGRSANGPANGLEEMDRVLFGVRVLCTLYRSKKSKSNTDLKKKKIIIQLRMFTQRLFFSLSLHLSLSFSNFLSLSLTLSNTHNKKTLQIYSLSISYSSQLSVYLSLFLTFFCWGCRCLFLFRRLSG